MIQKFLTYTQRISSFGGVARRDSPSVTYKNTLLGLTTWAPARILEILWVHFTLLVLGFNAALYAAGVTFIADFNDTKGPRILLGKEPGRGWCHFLETAKLGENPRQTAKRGLEEETDYFLDASVPNLDGALTYKHGSHREYVIGRKFSGSAETFLERLEKKAAAGRVAGRDVEKTQYALVTIADLVPAVAAWNPAPAPAPVLRAEGIAENINLYDFSAQVFKAGLQNIKNVSQNLGPQPARPIPEVPFYSLKEIHSLSEISVPVSVPPKAKILVALDLDETLVFDKDHLRWDIDPIHLQSESCILIEDNAVQHLNALEAHAHSQGHQIKFIGITRRPYEKKTPMRAEKLGIPFCRHVHQDKNGVHLSKTDPNIVFDGGIIHTNHNNKGYYLEEFLKLVDFMPDHIIMGDDLLGNLDDVYTIAKKRNISLTSYHMKGADKFIRGKNPQQTPAPKPAPVVPQPAPVAPKPAPVVPQPAPVVPQPAPVAPKPAPVVHTPAPKALIRRPTRKHASITRAPRSVIKKPVKARATITRAPRRLIKKPVKARAPITRTPRRLVKKPVRAPRALIKRSSRRKVS